MRVLSDSDDDVDIIELDNDEDNDNEENTNGEANADADLNASQTTRHKLRNIIGDEKLNKETQDALQAERERKKRIEEKRRRMESDLQLNSSQRAPADQITSFVLDMDPTTKEPLVSVDKSLVRDLKKHQFDGIKFMWDACYENVDMIQKGSKGSGCVLAHCMGLGKTLQVVTLVHTLLTHSEKTLTKRVLILAPKNVLTNWRAEFAKWTRQCKHKLNIFEMPYEQSKQITNTRLLELERWYERGGVCIMGYSIFSSLVHGKNIKSKLASKFVKCLCAPGADLVVCDEGHILKGEKTQMTKAVLQVATKRRIVLTGTPLQNNLEEYHCMVSFVKPKLLGTLKEFRNRFVNPINNGQHKDSTEADVRYMKKVYLSLLYWKLIEHKLLPTM